MTLDPAASRFRDLVRERTEGTPYVVVDSERGFDLTTDVADLHWAGTLGASGVREVYVHHVDFPAPSVFTVTDDSRSLTWGSQGPVLGATYNRSVGRMVDKKSFASWGIRPDGSFGVLWLTPHATELTEQDWNFPEGRFLSYVLGPVQPTDAPLYIVLNAAPQTIEFVLPTIAGYGRWTPCLQTARKPRLDGELPSGSKGHAPPRSILVFSGSR